MGIEGNCDFRDCYPQGSSPKYDGGSYSEARGATSPTYTPFMVFDFNGTNGASASQTEFSPEPDQSPNNSLTYSNAITGPFSETINARQDMVGAGNKYFGGGLLDGSSLTIANNTDTWIRIFHYFPSAFCAGYDQGTGEGGDGYGATKWLRYGFGAGGDRITHQLGGFLNSACGTAMNQSYTSFEIAGGADANTPSPVTIPRDQWVALQWQVNWQETATGFVRAWLDDTYLGEVTGIITKPTGDNILNDLTYGNYWNGSPSQAVFWYIQSIIGTQQTPNTLDSGGRPFISPATKVGDFA